MLDPPVYIPSIYADSDGFYSLDLNANERIALTRVIDDYVNIGSIKQDTFKELVLPMTKKNRLLLENIGNPSAFNINHNKVFNIQLLKGDFSYPVKGLQIVGSTDSEISVTIFGELNDWYRPLKNLFLNEIELGSDIIDYTWLNARHADNFNYQDTSYPVFPPLVNYGRWFINCNLSGVEPKSQIVFNNYRFWHSPLALLRQALCQVGYKLIAPSLETEEFRRTWCYLLDPNFETANQLDIANRPFRVERSTNSIFTGSFYTYANGNTEAGVILFPDTITDPGSHAIFNVATATSTDRYYGSLYSGGIIGNFRFEGTVRLNIASGTLIPIQPEFVTLTVSIKKSFRYGVNDQLDFLDKATTLATKTVIYKGLVVAGNPVEYDFVLDTSEVKIYEHEAVFVQVELSANLVNGLGQEFDETIFYDFSGVLAGAFFENTVSKQIIEQGDTIEFGKLLHQNYTALDLLKGIIHLLSLKLETDTINKTLSLYPEFKFNWYLSGTQEGYFLDNTDSPLDSTRIIQANSLEQSFKNTDLEREPYLKFINSTDGYITSQNLEQELHSKKIDLGANYRDGINEITNPFFEPLDIGIDSDISGLSVSFGAGDDRPSANLIPFMWESEPTDDSSYPDIGFNYTPRIAIAYLFASNMLFEPEVTGQDLQTSSFFIYEDTSQAFYNLFGQIFPEGVTIVKVGFPDSEPDLAIVYGNGVNPNIKDYYDLFYARVINQAYFSVALDFLVKLSLLEFSNISFRRKWFVKYKSGKFGEIICYARLSRVEDYVIGENITTPVQLIPDSNNFENC